MKNFDGIKATNVAISTLIMYPLEWTNAPDTVDLDYTQPVDFTFTTNVASSITMVSGSLPSGMTFDNGTLSGTIGDHRDDIVIGIRAKDRFDQVIQKDVTFRIVDINWSDVTILIDTDSDSTNGSVPMNWKIDEEVIRNGAGVLVQSDINGPYGYNKSIKFAGGSSIKTPSIGMQLNFTIEMWIYKPSTSTNTSQYIVYGGWPQNTNQADVVSFYISNQTRVASWIQISNTHLPTTPVNSFPNNTWNHLAWVRYNGVTTLYINGVAQSTGNTIGGTRGVGGYGLRNIVSDGVDPQLQFGGYNSDGLANTFTGFMDGIRVTRNVARYTSNFTPSTTKYPRK